MMKTVRSRKYQETISYYEDDIDRNDNGDYVCTGYGDRNGKAYDIILRFNGVFFLILDIQEV